MFINGSYLTTVFVFNIWYIKYDFNFRDIFDDLVRLKIKQVNDFNWQKQARFYYDNETDDIWVKITDVNFLYQNEYLGVVERLAITPLTDRCYITLAQAIGIVLFYILYSYY